MANRAKKKTAAKTEKAVKPAATTAPDATTTTESTAAPKQRGRKSPYDAETKAAILKAAADARGAGKSWAEALDAAKAAGYKGSLQYLVKMARGSGAVKVKGRRKRQNASVAPAVKKAKGKPGRPAKVARANNAGAGLGDIEKIVAAMVEARVGAAVNQAIAALENVIGELGAL